MPAKSRGAAASSELPMAVSATATGAMTWEARVTGCKAFGGCKIASASGNPLSAGMKRLSAHIVAV